MGIVLTLRFRGSCGLEEGKFVIENLQLDLGAVLRP